MSSSRQSRDFEEERRVRCDIFTFCPTTNIFLTCGLSIVLFGTNHCVACDLQRWCWTVQIDACVIIMNTCSNSQHNWRAVRNGLFLSVLLLFSILCFLMPCLCGDMYFTQNSQKGEILFSFYFNRFFCGKKTAREVSVTWWVIFKASEGREFPFSWTFKLQIC